MFTSILSEKKQMVKKTSSIKKYIYSFIATVLLLLIQVALKPIFGHMQYFLLFPLVFIVVAVGGIGPALMVIIVGGLGANQFLIDPLILDSDKFSWEISFAKFLIFAFSTIAGSWFIHKIQRNKIKLENDIEILQESDKKFKHLADSSPALIWMTNAKKQTTWFNKSWREYTGKELDDLLNQDPIELILDEDKEKVLNIFNQSFDSRMEFKQEYRLLNKNGQYRWILCNAVPMYSDQDFIGYIGVCVDINEHKLAEENIRRAVQSRDHFLSIASHELKTPISSLTLQAQVFKRILEKGDAISKDQALKISQQISRQVFRLDRLIDDMLDNSRINSGKFSMHHEIFDLKEIINESISRTKDHFFNTKDKSVTIHCHIDNNSSYIGNWDKIKIEQVVTNLLTNSVKYGNGHDVNVYVKNADKSIVLTVEDKGIGIDENHLQKIFDRFYRINDEENSGLGLGLFISKEIIKAHNGKIWVESKYGKGSKFFIELPKT